MMPEKWTKRSRPPSSGVMKPNPLSSENHLTVPVAMPCIDSTCCGLRAARPEAQMTTGRRAGPDPDKPMQFRSSDARATFNVALGALSAELLGGFGDLVGVARSGMPRQPQRVGLEAWDDVHVEVEDGLPGRRAARVDQVDAVGAEALDLSAGQLLGGAQAGRQVIRRNLEQIARVRTRNHEEVAARRRVDVHERDRAVVLAHARRGHVARDDLAE